MTISITFVDGSTRMLNPTPQFKPHDYDTTGSTKASNLQAIIEDLTFGKDVVSIHVENNGQDIINRKFKDIPVKYSYSKTPEEKKLLKSLK